MNKELAKKGLEVVIKSATIVAGLAGTVILKEKFDQMRLEHKFKKAKKEAKKAKEKAKEKVEEKVEETKEDLTDKE